ncbi:MAG: CRISPR-associated protein [Phaeodactylibacter sp.]|nr:CRISPR-associated protein [Phaeodactylibacter sp.]
MAEQQFGRVADLPFPNIPPHKGNEELAQLVNEYFQKIQSFRPTAVHLMGEMTFTFALVQKLKAAGTLCLASTTERLVQEKGGKKVVEFRFVQFRPY